MLRMGSEVAALPAHTRFRPRICRLNTLITRDELNATLAKVARNKAVGVDNIFAEAWQLLTEVNRHVLLDILTQAVASRSFPQGLQRAIMVEI